jgi:hypothetical protein
MSESYFIHHDNIQQKQKRPRHVNVTRFLAVNAVQEASGGEQRQGTRNTERRSKTHNQPSNCNNLDRCEPELAFTIRACTKHVDGDNDDNANGNPCSIVHARRRDPIIDQHSSGGQLGGKHDDPSDPHHERKHAGRGARAIEMRF